MDKGKKIEVSASTLVDLKAELFRKQEEIKRNRGKPQNVPRPSLKLGNKIKPQIDLLGKSNPGIGARVAKDQECQITEGENDALAASRRKLEEKAILYEKLMSGKNIPDEDDGYMVDFQRKTLDSQQDIVHETNNRLQSAKNIQEPILEQFEESEWTDYTDSLGRSRRCLKADLPKMIAMDLDLQQRNFPGQKNQNNDCSEEIDLTLTEEIPKIVEPPIGPMHYQNVQYNEIRSHGVGYFGFSQTEEERKQQMETLNQLRNQTKTQKARLDKVKEKRQAALKARLKKVKQRKLLKEGNVISESDSSDNDQEKITETQEAIVTKEEQKEEREKPTTVRPWDRGKIGPRVIQPFRQASQKEWVEKQRDERVSEFAPPSSYYQKDPVEEMHQFFKQQKSTFEYPQAQAAQPPCSSSLSHPLTNQSATAPLNINNIPLPND